ncbi:hydroxyacylglutathione hydrolase [Pasteurellaceae bacterium HPA106]|uniref:hydroxyacylglutathione hydrolase n=1 Tax=Spirabiliibacterium pneumoniae TaxID=221400 RepID=UPI001AAC4901|nr:hydroxyacylglutathione hydrolase [Spirabiliibacterium pneumoniae]MBE2896136.1 hydroxyacylglutathione hydrolase [Spirabiliibacterium pneumoniae]
MLIPLNALNDNYIWLYQSHQRGVLIIDPAETQPVLDYLSARTIEPVAILITHNHGDHTGGIDGILSQYPTLPVYAPEEVQGGFHCVVPDSTLTIGGYTVAVIPTFGHTAGHVSYFIEGHLFCGDSLFSAGCGRVFTGDYAAMFAGLQRLNDLPAETIICPAHEYTLANLRFAQAVKPSAVITEAMARVEKLRAQGKPSLPSTLAQERKINPFLQAQTVAQFTQLRQAKDNF